MFVIKGDSNPMEILNKNDNLSPHSNLLVSCPSDADSVGGLFYVDLEKNSSMKIFEGDCRGVDRYKEFIYMITQSHGVVVLNRQLEVVNTFGMDQQAFHGIRVINDHTVLIVETSLDSIGIYRLDDFERIGEIKISDNTGDKHHINDICIAGSRVYISMFSYSGLWRAETFAFDGVILEYDLTSKTVIRTVKDGLRFPHSVLDIEGRQFYCGSLDLNLSDTDKTVARFGGFTRGLAYDGRYFFVGQSSMRHLEEVLKYNLNVSMDVGIHIFDSQTHTNRFFPLPARQVYEIVLIDDIEMPLGNTADMSDPNSIRNFTDAQQWHQFEGGHRWMAQKTAGLILFADPSASTLEITAASYSPKPLVCKVYLNGLQVGSMNFSATGDNTFLFPVQKVNDGRNEVTLELDALWSPSDISVTADDRKLGIAVREVSLV